MGQRSGSGSRGRVGRGRGRAEAALLTPLGLESWPQSVLQVSPHAPTVCLLPWPYLGTACRPQVLAQGGGARQDRQPWPL